MKFSFKNLFGSKKVKESKRIFSDGERQAPIDVTEAEPSHLARYLFALNFITAADKVLDIPCGTGYGTKLLAGKAKEVTGIDVSEKAIGHAEEFFNARNDYFKIGDMENLEAALPADAFFDIIVSFEGIEHIGNGEIFLEQVAKHLNKGGRLIISTPRKPHGSPFHVREYSLSEFVSILEKKFVVEKMFGQIYTDIFELKDKDVDPASYKRFNFISLCTKRQN
jgi:2-polyprenyl-3-methyl-5-hydroxy-6-metoxy-1,4-benzoquinol methylase